MIFYTNFLSLERIERRVMGKFEIKTIGVIIMIMIMLSFTQAELDGIGRFLCKAKCEFECSEKAIPPPNCVPDCESHCEKLSSNPGYNCINGCRLMKSIAINIGMYYLKIFSYFEPFFNFIFEFINYFFFHDSIINFLFL